MPSHKDRYIRPEKAWKKLRAAQDIGHIVYIYGATGFGKTELARRYLEKSARIFVMFPVSRTDSVPGSRTACPTVLWQWWMIYNF